MWCRFFLLKSVPCFCICLLVVCAETSKDPSSRHRKYRVALHAQAKYSEHGWVAGSEITTSGLKRAFEKHKEVEFVQVFAPFSYDGLEERGPWDFVLIEGYSGSVPQFIRIIRDLADTDSPPAIAYFCLDTYPSLSLISRLDVDLFFTNSHVVREWLQGFAPSYYFELAADPNTFHPMDKDTAKGQTTSSFSHDVVFLGHNSQTKSLLYPMLREALPFGLAIYGHNWGGNTPSDLKNRWHGILPIEKMSELYSHAKVVLGITEDKQKSLGMINNRVFEVLGCGTTLLSDHFGALEKKFGESVLYYRKPGDVARFLRQLMSNCTKRSTYGAGGRDLVLYSENWDHRVRHMMRQFQSVHGKKTGAQENTACIIRNEKSTYLRRNRPRIAFVYEATGENSKRDILMGFSAMLVDFRITFIRFYKNKSYPFKDSFKIEQLDKYDIVVVHDSWEGPIETFFRSVVIFNKVKAGEIGVRNRRGLIARVVLLMKNSEHISVPRKSNAATARTYDALLCPNFRCMNVFDKHPKTINLFSQIGGLKRSANTQECSQCDQFFSENTTAMNLNLKENAEIGLDNIELTNRFSKLLKTVLYEPRASASISIQRPLRGDIVTFSETLTQLKVVVNMYDFLPPRDGMWCLKIDGVEIRCVGDHTYTHYISNNSIAWNSDEQAELNVTLVPLLRTHFSRKVIYEGAGVHVLLKRRKHGYKQYKEEQHPTVTRPPPWKLNTCAAKEISIMVDGLDADIERLYCQFVTPFMFSEPKSVFAGSLEFQHMDVISNNSVCPNCGGVVTPADMENVDIMSKIYQNVKCPVPQFNALAQIILLHSLYFKVQDDSSNTGDHLAQLEMQPIMTSRENNRIVGTSNTVKIQAGCEPHSTLNNKPWPGVAAYTLVGSDCLDSTNLFKSLAELPRHVILWNQEPSSLTALPPNSFLSVLLNVEVGQYPKQKLEALVSNIKRILVEKKGRIRITMFWNEERGNTAAELKAEGIFLHELLERNSFHATRVSPMTTTLQTFNVGVNQDQFASFQRHVVFEGCLGAPTAVAPPQLFQVTIQ